MSIEELQKAIEEMKARGQSDEEIAGAFYLLFRDGKIDLEQLEALVNTLGFELSEEFKAMDPEQQKEAGYEVLDENPEETSEKQEEKVSEDTEDDEENKAMKLLGQDKKEEKEETSEPEEENKEENKEDKDEEEKAMKFFR